MAKALVMLSVLGQLALALACPGDCQSAVDRIYDDTVQEWCAYLKRYRSRRTVMEVCRDSSKTFLTELCEASCNGEGVEELMENSRERQIEACRQYLQVAPMPTVHNVCVKVYTDGYGTVRKDGVAAILPPENVEEAKETGTLEPARKTVEVPKEDAPKKEAAKLLRKERKAPMEPAQPAKKLPERAQEPIVSENVAASVVQEVSEPLEETPSATASAISSERGTENQEPIFG